MKPETEIHLFTYQGAKAFNNSKITVHDYSKFTKYIMVNYLLLIIFGRYEVGKIKPDIIHAHYITEYGYICSLLGLNPLISTIWGSDYLVDKNNFYRKYMIKYVFMRSVMVITNSKNIMKSIDPKYLNKFVSIEFPLNIEPFLNSFKNIDLYNKICINNELVIISTRMLTKIYDVETLIKAFSIVLKQYNKIKLIIGGDGSQKSNLMELSKHFSNKIIFTGKLNQVEIKNYLSISDIYVSTSLSDAGLAASTIEAMACGLPVVISDFGDNSEWIKDGVNGFLFPMRNFQKLAELLLYLSFNEENRKLLGINAKKTAKDQFDDEKVVKELYHYYTKIMAMHERTSTRR